MIQLYEQSNQKYEMNGDYVLNPIKCDFHAVLNEEWELELENCYDDNYNNIVENAVISCKTPVGDNQLFRIYSIEKSETSVVAKALPIFFDSKDDCILFDVRPTSKNGQQALNIMMNGTKYKGISNILELNTSYYIRKNLLESISGTDENSFVNRWGGELSFNNYTITINKEIGADNGVRAEFGLNIRQIRETIDMSSVCTRIIPVSYNGRTLENNGYVDSQNINKFPKVYQKIIEYPHIKLKDDCGDNEDEGIIVCNTLSMLYSELIKAANREFESGIDNPDICYDIDMIDLSKLKEYENYKDLLKINLGDYIHCFHKRLDIVTIARVIEYTYDCITNKITNIVLGKYVANYFDNISSVVNSAKNVIDTKKDTLLAERINGVINLLNTSLKAQKNIAEKQDVRAILFEDIDGNSPTFGAMCIGTAGIQLSKQRNETNTDWIWGTVIDFQCIYAQYIITGILSDALGNNYWNLDTGELVTKNMKATNMKATNADISGRLVATSGNIAGFNLDTYKMNASSIKAFNFTNADSQRIQDIILGRVSPTSADYQRLDVNGDGKITASDYIIVEKIIIAGNNVGTFFSLYPTFNLGNNYSESVFEVSVNGFNKTKINQTGGLYSSSGIIDSLSTKSISNDGNLEVRGTSDLKEIRLGTINDNYSECVIKSGRYNNSTNLYIESNEYNGYIALSVRGESEKLYLEPSNEASYSAFFNPLQNGKCTLGTSTHRFYRLYSRYGEDATSDKRQKKDFKQFDERYIKLTEMLIPMFYKFKEQTDEHSLQAGFIAQDVIEAMNECGIDKKEFGAVKHSEWVDEKTGEEKDEYSLVYSMFIPLLTYYIQFKNNDYENRLSKIESLLEKGDIK